MKKSSQLAARLRELFIDGTWIANTNFRAITQDVTAADAVKTIGKHNSIADLVFHMDYYLAGILEVFEGRPLTIRDQYSFDRPPIRTEEEWQALVRKLISDAEAFIHHVSHMEDDTLEGDFVDPKYGTYERNIEAMLEHGYYHLGQISLIKKLVRNDS